MSEVAWSQGPWWTNESKQCPASRRQLQNSEPANYFYAGMLTWFFQICRCSKRNQNSAIYVTSPNFSKYTLCAGPTKQAEEEDPACRPPVVHFFLLGPWVFQGRNQKFREGKALSKVTWSFTSKIIGGLPISSSYSLFSLTHLAVSGTMKSHNHHDPSREHLICGWTL